MNVIFLSMRIISSTLRLPRRKHLQDIAVLTLTLFHASVIFAQEYKNSSPTICTSQPWRGVGVAKVSRPFNSYADEQHVCVGSVPEPKDNIYHSNDPDGSVFDHAIDTKNLSLNQTNVTSIGRSFTSNNLSGGTPSDNSIGISRGGFIVSADNYTIEYYSDGPDTLVQFQTRDIFYGDSTLITGPFDPRVVYDRYANRFIVVMALGSDSTANFLLVSFSKDEDPRNGWNHYRINSDTLDENKWFDFPTIGMNKNELFISVNVVADSVSKPVTSKIFQIKKQAGYDSLALKYAVWPDVKDDDGKGAVFMVPLSDGLMADSYTQGIYLVSNEFLGTNQTGTKLYWYHLQDSIGGPSAMINTRQLGSGVAYGSPLIGFQAGSNEGIDLGNTRIQSGYYIGGKLYFVYCKNTNGYCTIVLNAVDIATNTLKRTPWGFSTFSLDDCYPSIAFYGLDSTDHDNLIMCFQRTGISISPQLRAVHFDSVFAANSLLVRHGDGFIDNVNMVGQRERWGDYTTSQRRYDVPLPACWITGSYPVGPNGNAFGEINGLNGFIAEITDSIIQEISHQEREENFMIAYPNPATETITFSSQSNNFQITEVVAFDITGRKVAEWKHIPKHPYVTVNLDGMKSGLFVFQVKNHRNEYAHFKIVLD